MVYVGTCDCYDNIKIKLWSTISILKPWQVDIFGYKKKMIVKLTTFCIMLHPCCYWYITFHILLSPLNRLVTCHFIMPRMYIIRTSWEHKQLGGFEPLSRGLRERSPLRKFLGSKEHLDWLKNTHRENFVLLNSVR